MASVIQLYNPLLQPTVIYGLEDDEDKYMRIDGSINLRHEATLVLTDHPVEIGADITDHGYVNPRVFTLEGRISTVSTSLLGTITGTDSDDILSTGLIGDNSTRVSLAWEALENAMRNRRELYIETNLKEYESVYITSLVTNQDWRTARVLDFTATIKEVIKVAVTETEVTDEQIKEGDAQEQASPTVNRGDVQATDITDINLG